MTGDPEVDPGHVSGGVIDDPLVNSHVVGVDYVDPSEPVEPPPEVEPPPPAKTSKTTAPAPEPEPVPEESPPA